MVFTLSIIRSRLDHWLHIAPLSSTSFLILETSILNLLFIVQIEQTIYKKNNSSFKNLYKIVSISFLIHFIDSTEF